MDFNFFQKQFDKDHSSVHVLVFNNFIFVSYQDDNMVFEFANFYLREIFFQYKNNISFIKGYILV